VAHYTIGGYGKLDGSARSIEGGIGRIGENAAGTGDGLEVLGGIMEDLQRRNIREDP